MLKAPALPGLFHVVLWGFSLSLYSEFCIFVEMIVRYDVCSPAGKSS